MTRDWRFVEDNVPGLVKAGVSPAAAPGFSEINFRADNRSG